MLCVEVCVVLGALFGFLLYAMVKTNLVGTWAFLPGVTKDGHR